MRRIGVEERRARLGLRHHLAPSAKASDAVTVAEDLVALHGTDAASVFLAVLARVQVPDIAAIEHALYHQRALVRMLGMRRTMFVVPRQLVAVVQAGCTTAIAQRERRRLVELLEQTAITTDGDRWLREAAVATCAALAARGQATAAEVSTDVAQLRERYSFGEGRKWAGEQSVATRVLFVLAAEGRIVRGRPLGSWTSTLHRWVPIESWFGGPIEVIPEAVAQVELARRWLDAFGPGTAEDLKWWTGWSMGQVRTALAALEPVEVDMDGARGLMLPEDVGPAGSDDGWRPDDRRAGPGEPWAALLPALDPTVMGWSDRRWFLGDYGPALFDRTGNVGPTVWWDGRVVGGWAQRKEGDVVFRLLEDIGADGRAEVATHAEHLHRLLGPTRVTPRFRTPLERELTG